MYIGIIGVGYLGNFHLKQLKTIPNVLISGIYDIDLNRANKIASNYEVDYLSLDKLFKNSDAVCIVTPTNTHYSIANQALESGCHVFIEKPITNNINEAKRLIIKSKNINRIIQVGHIERFNPAFYILKEMNLKPQFIESHRLSMFNQRGNDISVILDLMIHDLDIILYFVKSNIKDIRANGIKVVSSTIDIANARIEFENKCVASITASRISQKNMRKMRFFEKNNYVTIDYEKNKIEEYKIKSDFTNNDILIEFDGENKQNIAYTEPLIPKHNALREELIHFIDCIKFNKQPQVNAKNATNALDLALQIKKIINNN